MVVSKERNETNILLDAVPGGPGGQGEGLEGLERQKREVETQTRFPGPSSRSPWPPHLATPSGKWVHTSRYSSWLLGNLKA